MALVTHGVATPNTANVTSYPSDAFTPAAGDLLVAFVTGAGTVAAGTMTDSQGLGFTKIDTALLATSASTIYLFVANAPAAASSMTVTFDCTGDAATGVTIQVARVAGMSKFGAAAVIQTAKQENQGSGTPAPAFSVAAQTQNPTLGVIGTGRNPAAMTPPTNWTEQNDTGFATPAVGSEYVSRNNGFTGTTITWGNDGGVFGALIVELNAVSDADASMTGLGTVLALGATLLLSTLSSDGVGALSSVGSAVWSAVSSASGTGTLTGVGATVWNSTFSSAGVGALNGVSQNITTGVMSSSGVGALLGVSSIVWSSTLSCSGVGVFTAESQAVLPSMFEYRLDFQTGNSPIESQLRNVVTTSELEYV